MSETTILGHTIIPASELEAERQTAKNSVGSLQQQKDELQNKVYEQDKFIEALKQDRDNYKSQLNDTLEVGESNFRKVRELEELVDSKTKLLVAKDKELDELNAKVKSLEAQIRDMTTAVSTEECIAAIEKAVASKKVKAKEENSLAAEVEKAIEASEKAARKPRKTRKAKE